MPRKAKIICTIGPTSESEEMLERLIKAGMLPALIFHTALIRSICEK